MTEFAAEAAQIALSDLEENLIKASREYEDAQRSNDSVSAAWALKAYSAAKREYDELTGRKPATAATRTIISCTKKFLVPTECRWRHTSISGECRSTTRATFERSMPVSRKIPRNILRHRVVRRPSRRWTFCAPNETEAARITGCDEQTYAANAHDCEH